MCANHYINLNNVAVDVCHSVEFSHYITVFSVC